MTYGIGLGSNLGSRLENLTRALEEISKLGKIISVSPVFENPPLLPVNAPEEWYGFFLNATLVLETSSAPDALLQDLKSIERKLERPDVRARWAPRTLDLDILHCDPESPPNENLHIPHRDWKNRSFVTTPLFHMGAQKFFPKGQIEKAHRQQKFKMAALMAAVNLTPDSFSKTSNTLNIDHSLSQIEDLLKKGVNYLDIGAESTRPGATPLSADHEWSRLAPVLELVPHWKKKFPYTQFSIDTYHPETAEKSLHFKIDILNDVQGLKSPRMQEVASEFSSVVLMHSLAVPADPQITLPTDINVPMYLKQWLEQKLEGLKIPAHKIIFDPGLGFGLQKTQTLKLLQSVKSLTQLPLRVLVGHSRKSFMNLWTEAPAHQRDPETLATSLHLVDCGVDILRVHDVDLHQRALRAHYAVRHPLV